MLLRDGQITDETRRRIEHDLDLEEASLANREYQGGAVVATRMGYECPTDHGVDLHPGLIMLLSVVRAEARRLMGLVIAHLIKVGIDRPQDLLS